MLLLALIISMANAQKTTETILRSLADIAQREEDWAEAQKYYERLIEINPRNEDYYFQLGFVSYELKDYEKARWSYARVLELNPKNPSAYYNFALVLTDENNHLQAMDFVLKAIQLEPTDNRFY